MRFVSLILTALFVSACSLSMQPTPPSPTATYTPLPTIARSPTPAPSATPTISPTIAPTQRPPILPNCTPRTDWPTYTVAVGDTLGSIAQRTNSTVNELASANCLANPNLVTAGQTLRVPRSPVATPTPTRYPSCCTGTVTITPNLRIEGNRYILQFGATVTLLWSEAPRNAARIEFRFAPGGTGSTFTTIGTDTNPADGAVVTWLVPDGALGHLMATAFYADNAQASSNTVDTYSGPLPTPTTSIPAQVRSFTVSPNPVARGGQVTITWDVTGPRNVFIVRLAERTGLQLEAIGQNLGTRGSLTYTIPTDYVNTIRFTLTDYSEIDQTATIAILCPFTTSLIAQDCPITQQTVSAAYQSFEGGHMVWRSDTRDIYVLYTDGTYYSVRDTWVEGEVFDDGRTPPEGRFAPARGFGKVWYNDANIRQRLGWATAQEQSYSTTWETHKFHRARYELTSNAFQFPNGLTVIVEDRWRSP